MSDTEAPELPPPVVANAPLEVADGVHVIPDGRVPLVPNIGIVVGSRACLVVDSGMGPRNGATVRRHAEEQAGGRPLFLTITHFHPEHGYGAQEFDDGGDSPSGYSATKGVVGKKCFRPISVTIHYDRGRRESSRSIDGGEFISREEFEAEPS